MSIHESDFDTPMRSLNSRKPSGVNPRRRAPTSVGIRGSSQPSTWPPSTSWISLRLLSTTYVRLSRANSICCGSGRVELPAFGQLLVDPVVERPMVLELERADRMRDALERVRDRVRVVVERVDAPLIAGAMVVRVPDPIDRRIAQVHVRARHVDLEAQHMRAVGELAFAHAPEQRRFSATLRVRYGLATPASVSVPRVARISAAVWLST